jgi:arginine deiminase
VGSETGLLRKVVVHTPGREISHVSPANQREYGFNDILYERYATREHDTLVALLRDVFYVEVLQFRDLLSDALTRANSMDRLRLLQTVGQIESLEPREHDRLLALNEIGGKGAVQAATSRLIHGEPVRSDASVSEFLNHNLYHLPPLPNLMLVRDLAAVVQDHLFVTWNAVPVRRRENLLWRFMLQYSEMLAELSWSNWLVDDVEMPNIPLLSLDGGNIVQPAPNVIVVGQSSRTGADAISKLTGWLEEHTQSETHLFIVDLPRQIEHLDTVLTMLSHDECLVFPPSLFGNGPESVNVLHVIFRPGGEMVSARPPELLVPLGEALGVRLRPVSCGGDNPLEQRREHWWGGACVLAVAPGKLIAFRSAQRTLMELEARGYARLESEAVLSGESDPYAHEKCVILVRGSELSRARGGPRSYVLPLVRDST